MIPFAHTTGPRRAKIVIVGEAWGETEDKYKLPFAGYSGRELFRMLCEVFDDVDPELVKFLRACGESLWLKHRDEWFEKAGILLTNTLARRPPDNNLDHFCASKLEVGANYPHPPLKPGKYLRWEYLPEVARLHEELTEAQPNLIVPMGNTACWAIMRSTKIGAIRGTVSESPWGKVLPTYHPAAVLRQWAYRPIVIADLMKAKREAEFPEIRRPERYVLVEPDERQISFWFDREATRASLISCDIETYGGQITMIGFATSARTAIVIPFVRENRSSYWPDLWSERWAWDMVEKILQLPCPKLFQNGLYDLQYLLRMGIRPKNCLEDTMLLHHSMYPELQKGLGFLGSIYTNEAAWKLMRGKTEELKRDE